MKEVGIMTWFTYNNYGTVLQAYALSKKLENMQVIPEIINNIVTCYVSTRHTFEA